MQGAAGKRRIGWMGWTLILLALSGMTLYGLWRYALNANAVALLDAGDRVFAGTDGARLARENVRFGPDPAQHLDIFAPSAASDAPRPVLVFFYGGSWRSGMPGEYGFVGRAFARAGYIVVLPGYRIGSDGAYPRMIEDGAAALKWVHDHVAEQGGDPQRVFVMGHSAGAYNAAMLTLERQWLGREGVPDHFIKGMIGLSGPYDFYPFTTDSARAAFGHAAEPELTQPVHFARSDAPPLLLLHGDVDETVKPRNSIALAKAITAAGAPTQAVLLKGVTHKGMVMKLAAPFNHDRRVLDAVLSFLSTQDARLSSASAAVQASGA